MSVHPNPLLLPIVSALLAAAPLRAQEPTVEVPLIDNPTFAEPVPEGVLVDGFAPIPWWRATAGAAQLTEHGLATQGPYVAEQPLAAYAPLARGLRLQAAVSGGARLVLEDGRGGRAVLDISGADDPRELTTIDGRVFEAGGFGRPEAVQATLELGPEGPVPRFTVRLESSAPDRRAYWRSVQVFAPLPCPSEEALRAEILEHLHWVFGEWTERALDRIGPRHTGYLAELSDVVTGEPVATLSGGPHILFTLLMDALEVEEVPAWRATFETFVEDWLELGFHPETGLPCGWDVVADRRRERSPREVHAALGLLNDLIERGPERFRARAAERARHICEHVVAHGVLPDGTVAPGYRPHDGSPATAYLPLRRLDVPAQLVRFAALAGEGGAGERLVQVARDAVLELEFTLSWSGAWDSIDPGWDDTYGHYGARSAVMWRAHPGEDAFRRVAWGGFQHFAPIWRDALRLGGNVAADQVRCWKILSEIARLEPAARDEIAELSWLAARSHFKGEQYGNGAWGDVTIYRFDPRANLQVGDLPGVPQNLFSGLAICYDAELGLRTPELRAMFTAVMRSTVEAYRRPYGFLATRAERRGTNLGGGTLRFAVGLVEMLRRLSV